MDVLFLVSLAVCGASGIVALWRQLQMLQQNSYFPSRYYKWVRESYSVETAVFAIVFCALTLLYTNGKYLAMLIAAAALLITGLISSVKTHRSSIKKLVVTARVKRLFSAAFISLAAFIALSAVFYGSLAGDIFIMLAVMFSVIPPLLTILCYTLTLPIEKAAARYYVNDAKKILKSHKGLRVIGITGSYGKTTTKFILGRILSEKYNVVVTPQSFNTPMGVVRTVRGEIKPQTEIFVCEMGAKNIGDIKEICDIVNPDMGLITSVGPQHLETFRSVDNVFKTKFELFDAVEKKGGETFINASSPAILERLERVKSGSTFGMENSAEFYADNISYNRQGSNFDLVLDEERISVSTKLLGLHSVNDIVGAAAVAYRLGVAAEDIRFAIASLKPTEHRLELKSFGGGLLIDDAYNSNPEGCLEAVRVLGSFEGMRRVIITPGLIELGDKEYECNYNLGLEAAKYCDDIILVGKNRSVPMRKAVETTDFDLSRLHIAASFKEAISIYQEFMSSESVVLLENDLPDNYLN